MAACVLCEYDKQEFYIISVPSFHNFQLKKKLPHAQMLDAIKQTRGTLITEQNLPPNKRVLKKVFDIIHK